MLFYTHLLLGILFFVLLKNYFSGGSSFWFLILMLLGSILPDIDEANSKIKRWSGIIGDVVSSFFEHRGIFHSLLLAVILFFGITYFFGNYYAWGLFLGYVTHLIGDGLTPMGVQVFYPFSKFRIHGPIKTGGMGETILLVLIALVIIKILV